MAAQFDRLLDCDLEQRRLSYLFELAFHCSVRPRDIDAMAVTDFLVLTLGIDSVRREIARANDG